MFLCSTHVQETICAWYHLLWDVLYATSCSYHAPTPLSTTGFDPPSPPPATWRCLRASYLHRLGRIGAFRTRPPLLPPAFDRWDTTGGTASGDRPIRTHKPMETRVEASPGRHGCIGPCLRPASRGRGNVGRICTARGGRNGRYTIHRHLAKGSEPGVKTKHTSQEHHGKKRSHRSSDLVHP